MPTENTPYEVEWTAQADRTMHQLPERIVPVIAEFAYGPLADNPHRLGKALGGEWEGHHSARRGEYRIVYRIDEDMRVLTIVRVAHRAHVYRRR